MALTRRRKSEVVSELGDTTVLIGQNNAGKTAILDAVRIALTRRVGATRNRIHGI